VRKEIYATACHKAGGVDEKRICNGAKTLPGIISLWRFGKSKKLVEKRSIKMEPLERKIAIKQITKADDKDYEAALKIYNDTTSVSIKADADSITFWLKKGESHRFKLLVFALYINDEVVGFAMMVYINRTNIITLDYIELCEQHRTNNAIFSSYINLLQIFLRENGYNRIYIVNETSNKYGGEDIDEESRFFKKISFIEDFGKIEANYCTPPIGKINYESNSEAFLYIKSNDKVKRISKKVYLKIVDSIYYDYYYVWYDAFLSLDKFEDYEQNLDKSFNSIKRNIKFRLLSRSFKVNYSPDVLFTPKNKMKVIAFLVAFILFVCPLFIWFYQYILNSLGIKIDSVSSIIGGVLSSLITAITTILMTKEKSW
jgi:hypothetical protein